MSLPTTRNYLSSLQRLSKLERFGSHLGLGRITRLLACLNSPQKNLKCILVAGTNGKGSTTAMLASILSASGKKTGSFFSPPIFSFRERIQIDGKQISQDDFSSICDEVLDMAELVEGESGHITHFEALTAIALLHFSREQVEYAVLEVGLGGRLDATNSVQPILSIITSIGLEHTQVLGKTLPLIAAEKAGIMRAGVPLVCAVQKGPALAKIKSISKRLGAPFHMVNVSSASSSSSPLHLRATGSFQQLNASCAAEAAHLLGVRAPLIKRILSSFTMPARWQKLSSSPSLLIDCCHNPSAALAIQPDLKRDFAKRKDSPRVLLFSAMKDKDYSSVLSLLAPHFDFIVLCRPPLARAAKMSDLGRAATRKFTLSSPIIVLDPDAALAHCKSLATKKGRILVCGSIYLLQFLFGEREPFRVR